MPGRARTPTRRFRARPARGGPAITGQARAAMAAAGRVRCASRTSIGTLVPATSPCLPRAASQTPVGGGESPAARACAGPAPQLLTEWRDAWVPRDSPAGRRRGAGSGGWMDGRRAGIHRLLPLPVLLQWHEPYLEARGRRLAEEDYRFHQ